MNLWNLLPLIDVSLLLPLAVIYLPIQLHELTAKCSNVLVLDFGFLIFNDEKLLRAARLPLTLQRPATSPARLRPPGPHRQTFLLLLPLFLPPAASFLPLSLLLTARFSLAPPVGRACIAAMHCYILTSIHSFREVSYRMSLSLFVCVCVCARVRAVSCSFGDLLSFTLTAFVELMDHGIVSWDTFSVAFIKKVTFEEAVLSK